MADDIHSGHRQRMRERFRQTELEGFQPHEVLEMLLYYGIPRKDTNQIAHALLDTFGDIHEVLSATSEQLRAIPGMTDNAVSLIEYLRAMRCYEMQEQFKETILDTYPKVCNYFRKLYVYESREIVRAAFLDEYLHLKYTAVVSEGHPTAATFSARKLIELSIRTGCNTVILAHNHPKGTAAISADDIAVTRILGDKLFAQEIELADHVIVGCDRAISLRECGAFIGLDCNL
ncbi:MAG TPA: hypothetical protein DCG49_10210 [Ruminococcus sp.]|nr:hypothetical protein [Ruminococcus sp.]